MNINSRIEKLESAIKPNDSKSLIDHLSPAQRWAMIAELTCRMDNDTYYSLPEPEKLQFHDDVLFIYGAINSGKTLQETLELLKEKSPDYRKELEQWQ